MSKLIDYANLASNLAQNVQLADLGSQMKQQVGLQQSAVAKAEYEKHLTDTLFNFSQTFKKTKDENASAPAKVLWFALKMKKSRRPIRILITN